jgi:single-strand DNA-binding protein
MNKVILMGRLTKDPELRYTSTNNTAKCTFTLAVNRRFKKDGQPEADFINIVTWSKTAEFAAKYFTKGLQVAVVGSMQNRSWENEGKKHYVTEVVADEVYFAESKKSDRPLSQSSDSGFIPSDGDDDDLPF